MPEDDKSLKERTILSIDCSCPEGREPVSDTRFGTDCKCEIRLLVEGEEGEEGMRKPIGRIDVGIVTLAISNLRKWLKKP